MLLEKSKLQDLPEIVCCHKDAFPNALSTKHGDRCISKMMEWYILNERGLLIHVRDSNGVMLGYCGGIITREPGLLGAASSITQYAYKEFLKAYFYKPWLIIHSENIKRAPYIIKNLLILVGLRSKKERDSSSFLNSVFKPFIGLVVIGVKRLYHGKGIGRLLLNEFERLAQSDGEIELVQLSVKSSNVNAVRFYIRNGWIINKENAQSMQLIKYL